uniref:Uncharacterized protein n=1 Tax=Brassica oleracea TaxID=3712 RepID=A0A3P6EWT6_BRAOL|nr:unnamed protein product [Brassica oleracea]
MEAFSTTNQTLQISGDETSMFITYSIAAHKVVVMVTTGILGLLQLINQQSSGFETHKAAFLSFCIFILFYAILRGREAIDWRLRPGIVPRLVEHASHLFGGLAVLVLVSVVYVPFALVLLLWFLWLSVVVYDTFNAFMIYSEASISGSDSPQLPPV